MIRFLKILVLLLFIHSLCLNGQFTVPGSVLSSGKWFRMAVTEDGIYRIDYSRLKQLGLDDPSYPLFYGNNCGQLSYYNDNSAPDDLRQIAVWISGDDDKLDEGEYVLIYARGTGRWKYDLSSGDYHHIKHNYSDTACYFITSGTAPGKKIVVSEIPSESITHYSSESDALYFHEKDQENLIRSGREWFERITSLTLDPGFSDLVISEGIKYRLRVAARSSVHSDFTLSEGSAGLKNLQTDPVNLYDFTGTYASITDSSGTTSLNSTSPVYKVNFDNNGQAGAYGWLDYLELKARRMNVFNGSTSFFFDSGSINPGGVTEFTITTQTGDMVIWDVTDPYNVKIMDVTKSDKSCKFKFLSDSLRTFAAFTNANATAPVILNNAIENQDLHASPESDMIIVSHPQFLAQSRKLGVFHSSGENITTLVVTPQQIYNEFSGGTPDICAIRNFVRMKYMRQKGTAHPLKYLLLFGDGSYENRTPPPGNPNFIPTYQSPNSNIYTSSFTSDDFYGLLEEGEGESEGTEDIGIGRFPVTDTAQASTLLNKIFMYSDQQATGDWRNVVCLAADDEDGNAHMSDAEGLAAILRDSVPFINTEKIYLDAFKEVTSASGQSYPDVNKAINDRINSGCLIFNYVGHGNESGLAHERVVKTDDINSWSNKYRLPLFITATCEFSRFDDMDINIISGKMTEKTSAGEMVLLNRNGGGIALMSTTRLVYSEPNYILNRNILNCAFDTDGNGNPLRFGDIIRIAKNRTGNGTNKRNFTLLGDPALKLSWPWHGTVVTDSVNSVAVTNPTDTLSALSLITISGHIEKATHTVDADFEGIVNPVVFDKAAQIKTLANDGGDIMEFSQWKNIIFSGKTKADKGMFSFSFIVPHDIDYSFGKGRISYYASEDSLDMTGFFSDIVAGGFSKATDKDQTGPGIRLFLNDTLFRNGGITDNSPRLLAIVEDRNGINITGSAIGHDLESYLDDDRSNPTILNSYFENDIDSYTRGTVSYDLGPLTNGNHSLTLKAWDNYNNSSQATIIFIVEEEGRFILRNLINFPNPFTGETKITAGHNRPDDDLNVTITIFSLAGNVIRIIKASVAATGYTLPPVIWDGNLEGGKKAGHGIYPYSVTVTTSKGEVARASGRMIIL